jgi:hypothetical protein
MAKSVLAGIVVSAEATETLTNWGLAGLGAFAVLLLSNADKLSPLLDMAGLVTSVCWIVLAAVFGMRAKQRFQQCIAGSKVNESVGPGLMNAMAKYNTETRPELEKHAKVLGLPDPPEPSMETAFRMAMTGQSWIAKLAGAYGHRRARKAVYPALEAHAMAARWAFSQRLNTGTMVISSGVAVLNLLCFLAPPPIFLHALARVFG